MHPRRLIPPAVVAAAATSVLMAGCGGGSSTSASTTAHSPLLAYSRCIRSHGVPTFPDPTSSDVIPKDQIPVHNPQLPTAANACKHVMPAGGLGPQPTAQQVRARVAGALSFARCVRSHGVPRFPDPTAQGELTVAMVQAQGIDVHAPAVLQAVQTCLPASHGLLTPAKVRRALNETG